MKRILCILLVRFLVSCEPIPCPATEQSAKNAQVDFDRLVQAIYVQEGGAKTRFPYGVERITASGKRYPYNVAAARNKCVLTCYRAFNRWRRSGCNGDFVDFLGKTYAQDPNWSKGVKKFYSRCSGNTG